MRRSLLALLAVAVLAPGCVEEEAARTPTRLADVVQLSDREPGRWCQPLQSIEVPEPRDDGTDDALRLHGLQRGANFIVLESFAVFDESNAQSVLTRARLYACPPLAAPLH